METDKVIELIQKYRHDILNHLQIIKGYASMRNIDKVNEKIDDMLYDYEQERKLVNLHIPEFALWLIKFNTIYSNIRLSYRIDTEKNLQGMDDMILNECKKVVYALIKFGNRNHLYEGTLTLKDKKDISSIEVSFTFTYIKENREEFQSIFEKYSNLSISHNGITDDEIKVSCLIPYTDGVKK